MSSIISGTNYFRSADVSVFPCAYRGYYVANNHQYVFNPESRGFTEANLTNIYPKLSASKTSYLVSWENGASSSGTGILKCVIGGYYFEINDIKYSDLADKTLAIKTRQINVDNNGDTTLILASYIDINDAYLDTANGNDYMFTGLAIVGSSESTAGAAATLKLIDSNGNLIESTRHLEDVLTVDTGLKSFKTISENSQATGDYAVALGKGSQATGKYSFAFGEGSKANGAYAFAFGNGAKAIKENSIAMGLKAESTKENSVALGDNVKTNKIDQIVVGKFNTEDDTNAVVVGWGTAINDRKNILTVSEDGTIANEGDINTKGNVTIAKNLTATGNISITGNANLADGLLKVTKATTTEQNEAVAAITELNSNININGNVAIQKSSATNSLNIGSTTAGCSGELNIYGTGTSSVFNVTQTGLTSIANETESNSTTSGALKVAGGAAIKKNLYIGGDCNIAGNTSFASSLVTLTQAVDPQDAIIALNGNTIITGNSTITGNLVANGNITLADNLLSLVNEVRDEHEELVTSASASIACATTIGKKLTVNSGGADITGSVRILKENDNPANLNVQGAVTLTDDLTVNNGDIIIANPEGELRLGNTTIKKATFKAIKESTIDDSNTSTAIVDVNIDAFTISGHSSNISPVANNSQPGIHTKGMLSCEGDFYIGAEDSQVGAHITTEGSAYFKQRLVVGEKWDTIVNNKNVYFVVGKEAGPDQIPYTKINGSLVVGSIDNNLSLDNGDLRILGKATIDSGLTIGSGNNIFKIETGDEGWNLVTKGVVAASQFVATSDATLKQNINDFTYTKSILDLPIKEFEFINDKAHKKHIGCLAQDLQKLYPELVHTNNDGYLAIEETKLVYLLLNEVKQLKEEIKNLKGE